MAPNMTVTFLGTTSGGGPTETRNCSSLVLDALGDGSLWMFDCAEGTVRQFAQQPYRDYRRLRMSKLTKIFITHMHVDHTMGLIMILRNVLGIRRDWSHDAVAGPSPLTRVHKPPAVEVYGPAGIRSFVRTNFNLTHSRSDRHYCVHELLVPNDAVSAPCDPPELLHENEEAGRDIFADEDGFWRDVADERMSSGGGRVTIDAGSIVHRDPCIGYIMRERPLQLQEPVEDGIGPLPKAPPRTIVILGDTSDPSALIPLIANGYGDSVSLLVHEATDAYIPPHIDKYGTTGKNRTAQSVQEKAVEKGHSTPTMAGRFANMIGAERLILNHIGARFPAPPSRPHSAGDWFRFNCMRELERQANEAWRPLDGSSAVASWDFFTVVIPPNPLKYDTSDMEIEDVDVVELMENTVNLGSTSGAGSSISRTVTVTHRHMERITSIPSNAEDDQHKWSEGDPGGSRKRGRGKGHRGFGRDANDNGHSRVRDTDGQHHRGARQGRGSRHRREQTDGQGPIGKGGHDSSSEEGRITDKRPRR